MLSDQPPAGDRPRDVQAVSPKDLPAEPVLADRVETANRAIRFIKYLKLLVDGRTAFGGREPRL